MVLKNGPGNTSRGGESEEGGRDGRGAVDAFVARATPFAPLGTPPLAIRSCATAALQRVSQHLELSRP